MSTQPIAPPTTEVQPVGRAVYPSLKGRRVQLVDGEA